jgi:hypothetical protein
MSPSAMPLQKSYSIASMGADGIGPEVISSGVAVLRCLAETLGSFDLEFTDYDWSSETYKKTGKYIPDGGLEQLRKHDAIFFGAVGAPGTYFPPFTLPGISWLMTDRCPGSYLPLVPAPRHLPTLPAIRQRAPDAHSSRHAVSTKRLQAGRSGLGHRTREQRGRVRGPGRPVAQGPGVGDGDRGGHLHASWRGAHHAVCVRDGATPAEEVVDGRDEE